MSSCWLRESDSPNVRTYTPHHTNSSSKNLGYPSQAEPNPSQAEACMSKSKREGSGEWFGSVWGYVDGVEERLGHLLRLLILVILNHKNHHAQSDPPVSVSRDQSKVGEQRSAAHYRVLLLPCGLLAAAHGQVCPCALDVTLPTPRQHRVPSAHDNRERE